MTETTHGPPEIRLPTEILAALHRAAHHHGADGPAAILRGAGTELGRPILATLSGDGPADPGALSFDDFWTGLRDYLSTRGWGTLSQERIHPGLGRVRAVDWAESGDDGESPLTEGLLAGLFTAVSGQAIDVMEAPRSHGADIEFVFGSPEAVSALRRLLDDGADLPAALDRL